MGADPLDDVDPNFRRDLERSERAVYVVASYFRRRGWTVTLPPIKVRPPGAEVAPYSDDFDLVAEKGARRLDIEVKQRPSLRFRTKTEFPYSTLITDAAAHYDRLEKKPDFYFILNADLSTGFVFSGEADRWTRRRRHSEKRGRERDYYEIALADVLVIPMRSAAAQ